LAVFIEDLKNSVIAMFLGIAKEKPATFFSKDERGRIFTTGQKINFHLEEQIFWLF
jgi:hypothetical protein